MLTDFFLATPDQLTELDSLPGPTGTLPTVQARRVDLVKLATLQELIEHAEPFDELVDALDSSMKGDEDGPWILPVPHTIVSALAAADDDRLAQLAAAWADTDEWIADGGTARDLRLLLVQLSQLARQTTTGKTLWVWICL